MDLYKTVPYCAKWREKSGLYLAKERLIRRTYAHKKERGLFSSFLNESYLECVRAWTSRALIKQGRRMKPLRMEELYAYLGLELATSLHRLNRLREYWSTSDLLGILFLKKVLSRDTFMNIRASLQIYASCDHEVALSDPLWHSRQLLEHFARNAATLAIPVGVSSLDENTVRCKGRTAARSYMKSKPVRFGTRFYAVIGWSHAHLHSFQDNSSGNKTGQTPLQRYTTLFRELRGAVDRTVDGSLVKKSSASALWCAQMAHQTQLHPQQSLRRLVVMDTFCTRHLLARQVHCLSDGEYRILGTVRFKNVDGINRPMLKEAIESLKHAKRGDWRLVQVYQKNQTGNDTVEVPKNAGFIVFKDRTVVSFYSNDLLDTPTRPIHSPDDHAVKCVHGLAPLRRWTGNKSLQRTTFQVPAMVFAYNLFMNGVNRFGQFRSTAATVRKEQRVTMSLLTFILDASIPNAHALLKAVKTPGEALNDISTMKQRLIIQLVEDHVKYKQQRATLERRVSSRNSNTSGSTSNASFESLHLLLETEGRKSVRRVLCNLLSKERKGGYTMYSCTKCMHGFHVNCFTLYHQKENLRTERPDVHHAIQEAQKSLASKGQRADVTESIMRQQLSKRQRYCSRCKLYFTTFFCIPCRRPCHLARRFELLA